MNPSPHASRPVELRLSADELAFLCNAINETFEAIGGTEAQFEARTGWSRVAAGALHARLLAVLDTAKKGGSGSRSR